MYSYEILITYIKLKYKRKQPIPIDTSYRK